ncbi:ABC transporter ATP-binding protein [Bifidobacterium saguini DSM 23967]|uniref:ABC transporter ATP-binding protein n=2 Tax=Bifidobacterium saguini TaxID=762210 RepID=A0A087DF10_9BIFI|nr:ATP-binding cassette domain-containing protein [Bifidobacterium saguini]KFI94110.1 ABC transporter ATP-binding protein [Bifidobacterium saguini DSM 23967]QTB90412.1 ATP-binding cassette domain-containing protein [Bifidobacterium saguini]
MSSTKHVFTASGVTCIVPAQGERRTIFENLEFAIAPGEIVDLVGPSGSGKSSLLTAFARLNPHATGTLTLGGHDSSEFTPQQWRHEVAYLPQKPILPGETVAEAIRLPFTLMIRAGADGIGSQSDAAGATAAITTTSAADTSATTGISTSHTTSASNSTPHRIGKVSLGRKFMALFRNNDQQARKLLTDQKIRMTLDAMGCEDIDLARPPHDLSGGQAARVSLARTLLTEPKVLLADEVDAGLDDENAEKVADIMATAAARGMAIIRIRHRPPDGRASRIVTLANGTLSEQAGEQA